MGLANDRPRAGPLVGGPVGRPTTALQADVLDLSDQPVELTFRTDRPVRSAKQPTGPGLSGPPERARGPIWHRPPEADRRVVPGLLFRKQVGPGWLTTLSCARPSQACFHKWTGQAVPNGPGQSSPFLHHYPLAFGIGQKESRKSWSWFLKQLRNCIGCLEDCMFISDQHKGIAKAMEIVYPNAPYGLCGFHMVMNIKNRFKREDVTGIFKHAFKCYKESEFIDEMNQL
ncbi:hypothetical protein Ddye_032363 [Dipteronia dyeriana]|uniref:MULE transposase domain-containing protein n=1 Tax=Dipteronia dyeriana TaxID=168575 RepID=A0AAD9TK91_9ROSI|nr:hypothetical protein Ddye_032363 [Dipteronia dyeriana]